MPVMISTLVLVLQEQQIGFFLKTGTSIALLCASGWTVLQMARTPAEVSFRNDRVLIKTFLEASIKPDLEKWHYVIDVRKHNRMQTPAVAAVTYGHTTFDFRENEWAQFKLLMQRLMEAREHYSNKVGASAT